MPAFAPISALKAHRALHQQVREAHAPGEIVINGTSYAAAVTIGAIEMKPRSDGAGWVPHQLMTATVSKTLLSVPPKSRTTIICKGETWRVDTVGGDPLSEAAWLIRADRFPTTP